MSAGIRVMRGDDGAWGAYRPREQGAAGTLDYGDEAAGEDLSAVQWLRERHISSLGVPLSAGLFRMQPSEFDFEFVAEETMYLLEGDVEVIATGSEPLRFGTGDMLFFPAPLQTRWRVIEPTVVFFTLLD